MLCVHMTLLLHDGLQDGSGANQRLEIPCIAAIRAPTNQTDLAVTRRCRGCMAEVSRGLGHADDVKHDVC